MCPMTFGLASQDQQAHNFHLCRFFFPPCEHTYGCQNRNQTILTFFF